MLSDFNKAMKRVKKNYVRIIAAIMTAVLVVAGLPDATGITRAESARSKYNELEQQAADLQDKIDSLEDDISAHEERRDYLESQIDSIQSQLDILVQDEAELQTQINELNANIAEKEEQIAEDMDLFKRRLRAMYMAGSMSNLEILLGADDFSDYIARSQLVDSVADHDKQLMEDLSSAVEEINKNKETLEEEVAELQSLKTTMDKKRATLDNSYDELNTTISELESELGIASDDLHAVNEAKLEQEAAMQRAEQEAANQIANSGGSDSSDGDSGGGSGGGSGVSESEFLWPVPGFYTIWSPYGWRWGRMHNGIDISGGGIYGARIIASKSGFVSYYQEDYYSGYGYCLIISHYDGTTTRYAHMSAMTVGLGQSVSQGDTIGYVGSTGDSTGPHLHYEITVNGSIVDPASYF